MTIDEDLLQQVDRAVQVLHTNRSAFMCEALLGALRRLQLQQLEADHERGHVQHPVMPDEFDGWATEQVWGVSRDAANYTGIPLPHPTSAVLSLSSPATRRCAF